MAKAVFVTYLIALSIGSASAYVQECAVGPGYWCKSFQNAQDCGAIRHCTDTVWSHDEEHALTDSSSTCQWCQKILENTHKGIQDLADNEDSIISTLTSTCELLPINDLSVKCTNVIKNYGTPVVALMKNERYATLCRLMSICSIDTVIDKPPVIIGSKRCTWGPSYWCSSLSNSRECNSIDHCSNKIWSQQSIEKKSKNDICQYCEYVIEQLRAIIIENKTEIDVKKWLSGACLMLKAEELINECKQTVSQYADEILVLIKNNIDSGVICHLGEMCKGSTIIPGLKTDDNQIDENKIPVIDKKEQSEMLCNVIVRATNELHVTKHNTQNEIAIFLKNDCEQLSTAELKQECGDLVDLHGKDIYEHVANNVELSKICRYIETDHIILPSASPVHCELCTLVLATAKHMLDYKESEDKVLHYIEEQMCVRLTGAIKQNCKGVIDITGKDLISNIQRGIQPMLMCTYFQICLDEINNEASPIQQDEMRPFLQENICNNLGVFSEACNAFMESDATRFLRTLANDLEGDTLCQMVGICPTKMSIIDNLSIGDHKNQCNRCVDDFTRRKHIAEKLLNHSSEFLHHLCGQLPQPDECTKAVDDSINKLVQFIRSLDPQDICVQLKMCNATSLEIIELTKITSSDNIISQEVIKYIKNEICSKIGPFSKLCEKLIDSEGSSEFALIAEDIDPHKVCKIIDICPKTTAFDNCNNKCDCCVTKVEQLAVQVASFLQTMVITAEVLCDRMTDSDNCREAAAGFETDVKSIISSFNAKRTCQALTHCINTPVGCTIDGDKCQCCQNHLSFRQNNFRVTFNEISSALLSLCADDNCRSSVRSTQQQTLNQIDKMNSLTLCQRFGFCTSALVLQSVPYLSNLLINAHHSRGSSVQTLEVSLSTDICSEFGELQTLCEYLIASPQSHRYATIYMAFLKNDPKLIDEDLREQTTDTCDACKNFVQSTIDFWNNSLESVRDVLLRTCERCPAKNKCRDFYNQGFNAIQSYLNNICPTKFCQSIHLCSVVLTDKCSTCIQRLESKKDAVLQSVDRITGYFNDLCQKSSRKQCQIFVKKVHDFIQQSINNFDPKQTCNSIGFCSINAVNTEIDFNEYEKQLEADLEKNTCSTLGPFDLLCKLVVHGDIEQIQTLKMDYNIKDLMHFGEELTKHSFNAQNLLFYSDHNRDKCKCCIHCVDQKKNCTKNLGDKIISTFNLSCDYCPAKDECRKFWQNTQTQFDSCIDNIDSKQVCSQIGFCNASSFCDNMGAFREVCEKSLETKETEIKEVDSSDSTCILCEYIMNILSNYIHSQSTEEEIEQGLQKVCNQMPSILQNQCHELIINYSPAIIAILLEEFNISVICHKLNLCTNQMKVDMTYLTKTDTATCGVCDYVSTYLHFVLKRDTSDKSLQHALSTVCTHLSDEQKAKCQTIVHLFSPHIRQLELSPGKNFCQQLTLCQTPMIELKPGVPLVRVPLTKEEEEEKRTIIGNLDRSPQCTLCHYVISYLDAIIKNNKSEEAFQEALKKVCSIIPSKERAECDEFVKSYGPVLADLIVEMVGPAVICRYLGMCQATLTKTSTPVVDYVHSQTSYTCTICQFTVSRMKNFVGLKQTEDETFASIKESCDLFSVISLKEQCKDFLNQYGSHFIKMISNDIEPRAACKSIGICDENLRVSKTTPSAPVLPKFKYNICLFGINYWCENRENAKLCNAIEICERHVWSKKNRVFCGTQTHFHS